MWLSREGTTIVEFLKSLDWEPADWRALIA